MDHETEKFFFSVTEASRLTGIDKKGIYNKCGNGIVLTDRQRKGRKFIEAVISFDDVCKLDKKFKPQFEKRMLRLFTLFRKKGLAFRVNEVTWLLGLSNQWVFKRIQEGNVPVFWGRREHRFNDEKLILAKDLILLKDEPNIKEKVFELFT